MILFQNILVVQMQLPNQIVEAAASAMEFSLF
jgi:hypothetical protein